jgi:hypothetical protein
MAEDHGLTAAPVFVVKIDGAGVVFADRDVRHGNSPFL